MKKQVPDPVRPVAIQKQYAEQRLKQIEAEENEDLEIDEKDKAGTVGPPPDEIFKE